MGILLEPILRRTVIARTQSALSYIVSALQVESIARTAIVIIAITIWKMRPFEKKQLL